MLGNLDISGEVAWSSDGKYLISAGDGLDIWGLFPGILHLLLSIRQYQPARRLRRQPDLSSHLLTPRRQVHKGQ